MLGHGFVAELVEFAGIRVTIHLLVPESGIVGLKPLPKISKLFWREVLYVLFDSVKFGHSAMLLA
jgi:hypothetical protein